MQLSIQRTLPEGLSMDEKKMIAPIIITVILVLTVLAYVGIWAIIPIPVIFKLVIALILMALIGVALYNLYERIQEIRSGEEDDLSNY